MYTIVDIQSSALITEELNNTTTTLSDVWYRLLKCQYVVNVLYSALFCTVVVIVLCMISILLLLESSGYTGKNGEIPLCIHSSAKLNG